MATHEVNLERPEHTTVESIGHEQAEPTVSQNETFQWDFNIVSNILALSSCVFVLNWVLLVPSSSIPFIAARFPEDINNASWIATSILITMSVFSAFIGDLSDIFDRRSFLLFGSVLGIIGTTICGRATSLNMVIGGQVLNGIGVACCVLAAPLIQEIVPNVHRPMVTAFSVLMGSFTFIGTPIIQGVFISRGYGGELDGWRIGFYVGAGLFLCQGLLILAFYRPMDRPNPEGFSIAERVWKLDWVGIFLSTAAVTLFLVGINSGNNPYPWTSGMVLGPLLSGIACLGLFVAWEWVGRSDGILPHALWEDPNYRTSLVIRVVGGFALLGSQAFIPQLLVQVFNTSGILTAVWQLPFSTGSILGAFFGAFLLKMFKEVKWITMLILSILALGAGLMILIKPHSSYAVIFFATGLMGIAVGAEAALLSLISGLSVPQQYIATAVSVAGAATYLGGAVASTMYSQIYGSRIRKKLPEAIMQSALESGVSTSNIPDFLSAYLSGNSTALATIPGVNPGVLESVALAAKYAYAESFRYIWIVLICFSVLSIGMSFLYTSTAKYFTNDVAAPIKAAKSKIPRESGVKYEE